MSQESIPPLGEKLHKICIDKLRCTKISIFTSELFSNFSNEQRVLNMNIYFWYLICNRKSMNGYQGKKIPNNHHLFNKSFLNDFISDTFMHKKYKFFKSSLFKKLAFHILHKLALLHHVTFACLIAEIAHISDHG